MADTKTTDPDLEEELEDDDQEVDDESQDETDDDASTDDDQEDDEETDDESDESDDEDTEDEEDDESDDDSEDFKQRFTQFKGEDLSSYTKNLEGGYLESSKEAVRLAKENKTLQDTVNRVNQLIATNPDLAKALQAEGEQKPADKVADQQVVRDPAVLWAESEMKRVQQKEYDAFVSKHPEIETDPKLATDLDAKLKVVADVVWNQDKRQVGMGEALDTAWKLLGMDDSKEKVSMAVKETGSQGKTSSTKKSDSKGKAKFTEEQIRVAMDMMNVDRNQAIKNLSSHVK